MEEQEISIGECLDIAAAWKKQYRAAEKIEQVLAVLSGMEGRESVLKRNISDLEERERLAQLKAGEMESELSRKMAELKAVNARNAESAQRISDQEIESNRLAELVRKRLIECSTIENTVTAARTKLTELDKVHKTNADAYRLEILEEKKKLNGEIATLEQKRQQIEQDIHDLESKFADLAAAASKIVTRK